MVALLVAVAVSAVVFGVGVVAAAAAACTRAESADSLAVLAWACEAAFVAAESGSTAPVRFASRDYRLVVSTRPG